MTEINQDTATDATPLEGAADPGDSPAVEPVAEPAVETTTGPAAEPAPSWSLTAPGEEATDDDRSAFETAMREHLGVPDSADKYEVPDVPETWSDELKGFMSDNDVGLGKLLGQLHENGASPAVAKASAGYMMDFVNTIDGETTKAAEAMVAQGDELLSKEYGDDVDGALTKAAKAWESVGLDIAKIMGEGITPATATLHPEIKLAMVKLGNQAFEQNRDPVAPGNSNGSGVRTMEDINRRIGEFQTNRELNAKLISGRHPDVTAEYQRLLKEKTNAS